MQSARSRAAGEVADLMLVAEQDIDEARIDHAQHALAAVADAQALRQSEGDGAVRPNARSAPLRASPRADAPAPTDSLRGR